MIPVDKYVFTELDNKVLDFMRDNFIDLLEQVEEDKGKSTYWHTGIKLEITFEKREYK